MKHNLDDLQAEKYTEREIEIEIEMQKVKKLKTIMDIGYNLGMGITMRAEEVEENLMKKGDEKHEAKTRT